jgi:hypothetical protein
MTVRSARVPYPLETLAAEFDSMMGRAGLTVTAERRAQVLVAYTELRDQLDLLRGPRTAAAEPSNVFSLRRIA